VRVCYALRAFKAGITLYVSLGVTPVFHRLNYDNFACKHRVCHPLPRSARYAYSLPYPLPSPCGVPFGCALKGGVKDTPTSRPCNSGWSSHEPTREGEGGGWTTWGGVRRPTPPPDRPPGSAFAYKVHQIFYNIPGRSFKSVDTKRGPLIFLLYELSNFCPQKLKLRSFNSLGGKKSGQKHRQVGGQNKSCPTFPNI
jgi:hypothetical protein